MNREIVKLPDGTDCTGDDLGGLTLAGIANGPVREVEHAITSRQGRSNNG